MGLVPRSDDEEGKKAFKEGTYRRDANDLPTDEASKAKESGVLDKVAGAFKGKDTQDK